MNISIPANGSHGRGYVIYGVATPQGTLSLTNVSSTLAGATPAAANNGTARLADIDVITANSFSVQLNTTPVTLPDPDNGNVLCATCTPTATPRCQDRRRAEYQQRRRASTT